MYVYINGPGHKKKMAAILSRTRSPMILKLSVYHWGLKLYKVYINDDPVLNLTYLTTRSNWVTCTFEWGKLLKSHIMEENLQQRTVLIE